MSKSLSFSAQSTFPAQMAVEVRNQEIIRALRDRAIEELSYAYVSDGELRSGRDTSGKKLVPMGSGNPGIHGERVKGIMRGGLDGYQVRLQIIPAIGVGNGVSAKFRLDGWSGISYLALGYTESDRGKFFRHVKVPNPKQGAWTEMSFGLGDIISRIQHQGQKIDPTSIEDVCVYVRGTPSQQGATIDVKWASAWSESPDTMDRLIGDDLKGFGEGSDLLKIRESLFGVLKEYFHSLNQNIHDHASEFLRSGQFPLVGGAYLEWEPVRTRPSRLDESPTYRYLWHSMWLVRSLAVHGVENENQAALSAARDCVSSWMEASFFRFDEDIKFTWYDHGTAERLLTLVFMHEIGSRCRFDKRFMDRLRVAIYSHAQLLESEAFYSSHQSTRYHNHAWFQDIALIAVGVMMNHWPAADRWLARGIERLEDQLSTMVIRDGDYAIFVENSIGYHHGIQRLVEFAGDLTRLTDRQTEIPAIAQELKLWSKFLRYPGGRAPSHGDTYRKPNPVKAGDKLVRGRPYSSSIVTVLPDAGYAVVKSNHDGRPYMLCMFATSLCKTHKHEDNLSITLWFDGIEWLIDPSFYSHDYDEPIPAYLRSAKAHNTLRLSDVKYSLEAGRSRLRGAQFEGGYQIEGEHSAYEGFVVQRKIEGSSIDLAFRVRDTVKAIDEARPAKACVQFIAGEGVVFSVRGSKLHLSCEKSEFTLEISLPALSEVKIHHGSGELGEKGGIAGIGFRQLSDVQTAQVIMPGQETEWEVSARRRNMESTDRGVGGKGRFERKIVLHAGLPKTGSSAIQSVMYSHRIQLESSGIHYPEVPEPNDPRHSNFTSALFDGDISTLQEFLDFDSRLCVISDESMSNSLYFTPEERFFRFRELCRHSGVRLEVVVVDRERVAWLSSYYAQAVMNQRSKRFDYYSTSMDIEEFSKNPYVQKLLDREILFADLGRSFGCEVTVLPYGNDVVNEFLSRISAGITVSEIPRVNSSVPGYIVELVRRINGIARNKQDKYNWIKVVSDVFPESGRHSVTSELAERAEDNLDFIGMLARLDRMEVRGLDQQISKAISMMRGYLHDRC